MTVEIVVSVKTLVWKSAVNMTAGSVHRVYEVITRRLGKFRFITNTKLWNLKFASLIWVGTVVCGLHCTSEAVNFLSDDSCLFSAHVRTIPRPHAADLQILSLKSFGWILDIYRPWDIKNDAKLLWVFLSNIDDFQNSFTATFKLSLLYLTQQLLAGIPQVSG